MQGHKQEKQSENPGQAMAKTGEPENCNQTGRTDPAPATRSELCTRSHLCGSSALNIRSASLYISLSSGRLVSQPERVHFL
jgi:hypothetical protein